MIRIKIDKKALTAAVIDSGLGLEELAKKSGVSKQVIWKITSRNQATRPDIVYKIGKALGVKPSSLAAIDDDE